MHAIGKWTDRKFRVPLSLLPPIYNVLITDVMFSMVDFDAEDITQVSIDAIAWFVAFLKEIKGKS